MSNQPLRLSNWTSQARAHWKEHLPGRYKSLEVQGTLDEELMAAAKLTELDLEAMMEIGATYDEAFQAVRETYLFPPEE